MTVVAMKDHPKASTDACSQVLQYWHQLEFFSPFNLDEAVSHGESCLDISFLSLQSDKANQILPWLNTSNLSHYKLYLMPFDKKELTSLSNQHFPVEYRQQNRIEIEEKLDDEGLTCFARLFIDKQGCPNWDGFSVSTLPWAMGMLQSGEFNRLSLLAYEQDMMLLKASIDAVKSQFENSHEQPEQRLFDAKLLLSLLKNLCQWARFAPDFPFVVKIQPIFAKQDTKILSEKTIPANLPVVTNVDKVAETTDDSLPILNSFFIQDLEKAFNYIANHDHTLLQLYINGCNNKKEIQNHKHRSFLLSQLKPNRSNLGRWPAPDNHMMSLMQQLCINVYINANSTQPMIATNGPPGTGKTTLLKDIISENIVQRALKLASFLSVNDCFSERKKIIINGEPSTIGVLKPEITGFEMLVVSSNNAAVENITRELPLQSNLAEVYQTSCQYLRPVAAKLSANHHKQSVIAVPPSLQPWGLIAVALGNSSNCFEFIQKFFFSPDDERLSRRRVQTGDYLTIWEWRDRYQGLSFANAQANFMHAWKATCDYQKKLQTLSELHDAITKNAWGKKIIQQTQLVAILKQTCDKVTNEKQAIEQSMIEINQEQSRLFDEINQQLHLKPSFWKRVFYKKETALFNKVMDHLQTRRLNLSERLITLQKQYEQVDSDLNEQKINSMNACKLLKHYQTQQQNERNRYAQLKASCPGINIPTDHTTTTDHIIGYWQSEAWNAQRSNLFICALKLHEAWLAEALQKKLFGGNLFAIKAILEGKHPLSSADELVIWQSLFMMIPVVSSTFASIGRLFKNVTAQSFGYLLIDEAGQSTPQAAVGALLRCKKAIIVGDPRQIEPIMTVAPHLIEGVAKHHLTINNPYWLPHATSIQKLADLASPLGTTIQFNQQQEWIGIPLLVHRRCLEPMFSIANQIAYENKMIQARLPPEFIQTSLPISAWFDVSGTATDKQFVPEHANCLLELFIACYNHDKGLPSLFIITPFKQIRKHLKTLIANQHRWIALVDPTITIPTHHEIQRWSHQHIGTVHTFQGKENKKVIFVLGADNNQTGAVAWASSKPNLLNVALTRAKDRIYIIGSWDLWAHRPFFSQASAVLDRIPYK